MSPMTPTTHGPSRTSSSELRAQFGEFVREKTRMLGDATVRPEVMESWERCLRYGLSPGKAVPKRQTDPEADAALLEMVATTLAPRLGTLRSTGICLSLTNADGVIMQQWAGNAGIMKRFEQLDVVPGFCASETIIGTSSGTTLVTRQPTMVRGPEHFAPQFSMLTSAGAVISHPINRRVVGSLHLTCSLDDTTPMALAWICDIVADIERQMLDLCTQADQLLLRGFLRENRDARHAVVAVNAQTAITNAAAAHLLGNMNQVALWDYASQAFHGSQTEGRILTLDTGEAVRVNPLPVHGQDPTHGVVLRLSRAEGARRRSPERVASLSGLVGKSESWTTMCRRLARAGKSPILLVGDPGTGKASVARALVDGSATVVDAHSHGASSAQAAYDGLVEGPTALLLLHVDSLSSAAGADLAAVLRRAPADTQLVATSRARPASGAIAPELVDLLLDVIEVPSLHERQDDVLDLVSELARRRLRGAQPPRWMPDALRALSNCRFPENVRSLDRVVAHALAPPRHDYIGVSDLPAHVGSKVGRRPLTGLEQVEADAILQALRDSDYNKHRAAEALGIARSTLYRKMRALDLDAEARF